MAMTKYGTAPSEVSKTAQVTPPKQPTVNTEKEEKEEKEKRKNK